MAPRHGFEPRFTAPKAAVLPLDDRGISGVRSILVYQAVRELHLIKSGKVLVPDPEFPRSGPGGYPAPGRAIPDAPKHQNQPGI